MNACSWRPKTVTLHDGSQVLSDSEAWRNECEAHAVLSMGKLRAREYLRGKLSLQGRLEDGVLQKRGEAAAKRLEQTILAIWNAGRNR